MRHLVIAAALLCSCSALAQNNLPPTWSTTGSAQSGPFKDSAKKPAPRPAKNKAPAADASAQPGYPQPPETGPQPVPQAEPVQQPVQAEPVQQAPVYQPPVQQAPVYQAPVQQAPVYQAPVQQAPIQQAPVYQAPAQPPPAVAPVQQAPVYPSQPAVQSQAPAPVQPSASVQQTPVQSVPIQQAPLQPTPVQPAPIQPPAPQAAPAYAAQPQYLQPRATAPTPTLTLNPRPAKQKKEDRKAEARAARARSDPSNGWIDISAPISPIVTPVYEGNPPLQVRFTMDMERGDALDLSLISMGTHTGTHVDAPLHFVRGAASIDEVPLERLVGPALVINVDPSIIAITAAELERYQWRGSKRILFRTRNSVNGWIIDPKFHRDFTFLAPDAAQLLAADGVELVGIDYLSIEQFGVPVARTHQALLGRGIPVVEGLDLRNVSPGDYDLVVLPLKILGHEAAPARAILRRR